MLSPSEICVTSYHKKGLEGEALAAFSSQLQCAASQLLFGGRQPVVWCNICQSQGNVPFAWPYASGFPSTLWSTWEYTQSELSSVATSVLLRSGWSLTDCPYLLIPEFWDVCWRLLFSSSPDIHLGNNSEEFLRPRPRSPQSNAFLLGCLWRHSKSLSLFVLNTIRLGLPKDRSWPPQFVMQSWYLPWNQCDQSRKKILWFGPERTLGYLLRGWV